MKWKYSALTSMLCTVLGILSPKEAFSETETLESTTSSLYYEAYLESWDPNYVATIGNFPAGPSGGLAYTGVTVNIAFAELDLTTPGYFRGLGFSTSPQTSATDVNNIVTTVQSKGGKVKISFGGQANNNDHKKFWFQSTTGFPNNAASLATGLAAIFNSGHYPNLDGLDFDIEEQLKVVNGVYPVTHQQFATYLLTFLQTLRTALPGKIISITIPGQAWPATWKTPPVTATYWQLLCQSLFTAGSPNINVVDYVNIMEYPLVIISGNSYNFSQIVQDINYYVLPTTKTAPGINHPGWGILPSKIQLGLCVASAAPGQTMLPTDMQKLAQAANTPTLGYPNGFGVQLRGVMIWDLSLDAQPSRANPPVSPLPAAYAYSTGVRQGMTQTLTASVSQQARLSQTSRTGSLVTSTRDGNPAYVTPTAFPNPD